ncbi:MAG: hypothetical protein CPDRYMAC_6055 [uncultured Paraburkholderia sp.]|nr:MAG: hypothetical protein CPDRYDRY_6002 [uncultured Paraburkholderia sp.]CAH2943423.1 MAG: hypothetical protein CPDRYMAC_6055 [uncultured Paraburkholderia sp.]
MSSWPNGLKCRSTARNNSSPSTFAPTLFREGHKNSPEKELQETLRPHATTSGFARRTSIFYGIRQGRIHGDSTTLPPSPLPHESCRTASLRAFASQHIYFHYRRSRRQKTFQTSKKVIFVWANASTRSFEISLIHVDNGPSGCTALCTAVGFRKALSSCLRKADYAGRCGLNDPSREQ